ncbi:carboxypeptidase regulatory-like domain-containing protein [Patescibacteria group bacterium]
MLRRLAFTLIVLFLGLAIPQAVDAASLYLVPSSGSRTVGDSFSVTVSVNTDGVAINASDGTISFPTDILEVTGVSKAGTFSLWTSEPSYSNASGSVSYSGGLPTPGYTGAGGGIITITFRGKAEGTATVSISSGSVLANDGLGTNVLSSRGSGTYTILPPGEDPDPDPEPDLDLPSAPTITSPTHPEQSLWYSNAGPSFEWTSEDGVTGYSFSFDSEGGTTPDTTQDGTDTSTSYSDNADGIWYFHVRARNEDGWGPAGHFKVQIDTTPPLPFNIFALIGSGEEDQPPLISFETTDEMSGVHHYDLTIGDGETVGVNVGETTPYALPDLADGSYDIVVMAYDFAGNSTRASATLLIGETVTIPDDTTTVDEDKEPLSLIDRIDDIAKKTEEQIRELLPGPINNFIDNFNKLIDTLRANDDLTGIIDEIIEPVATTALILTSIGVATTTTTLELTNLIYLLFRFGYFWLLPISIGKKRKPWGVVFDSTTGRPIKGAVVRVFSKEFNKLRESQITDEQGRFGFLVDVGEYYVTVSRPGYLFPSRLLTSSVVSQYDHIYRGESFGIHERVEAAISINVPIDPEERQISHSRMIWLRILNILGMVLEKANTPLLIGGTVISWITLILQPKLANYFILALYGFLILLKLLMSKRIQRSWGSVTDINTGESIELAVVRIYSMATGAIMATKISNREGKFTALVRPGQYYIMVMKVGYDTFQSQPITVTKQRGLIKLSVQLNPVKKKTTQAPTPTSDDQKKEQGHASTIDLQQVSKKTLKK